MLTHFDSLFELAQVFADEQTCIDHLRAIRWKDGAFCPYCGNTDAARIYNFSDNRTHKCADCRQRFSIKVGTIFEDTKLPLCKWFMAIWLITSRKKGIASTALAKDLKITQKSAWFVLHRLRYAARTKSFNKPLKGEIDETFVGGKNKNKNANKRRAGGRGPIGSGKVLVMGMLERGGELRAMKIESVKARELQGKVVDHVERGSTIITDEWVGYRGLAMEYTHHKVNHAAGEYVRDKFIHTNSLEGA